MSKERAFALSLTFNFYTNQENEQDRLCIVFFNELWWYLPLVWYHPIYQQKHIQLKGLKVMVKKQFMTINEVESLRERLSTFYFAILEKYIVLIFSLLKYII